MLTTYQTKKQTVEAIKIERWTDDYMITSKWKEAIVVIIGDRGSKLGSTISVDIELGGYGATVPVGNYLLKHEDGSFEVLDEATFLEKYEEREKDELLVGLAHALVKNFGFTFQDSITMLEDDKTRAILISALKKK